WFGIIIEDDRQNFARHVTEPTRDRGNRANRPTRLVPTTPLPIRRPKQIRFIQTPSHLGVVFLGSPSYKVTFANREFLNGQKGNETTRMDTAACPHIEGA